MRRSDVFKASYYRSPVVGAVKELFTSGHRPRPEIDQLRARIRELKAAVATYANQIQILALHNADLETDTRQWPRRARSR